MTSEENVTSAEHLVADFITAIEAMDVDRALSYLAPEAEYDNVPMSKAVGHEAIRGVLGMFLGEGTTKVTFEVLRQAATGNLVLNERVDRITMNGKTINIPVAGVFEVADGKITLWRDYFDMAQFTAQMS